MKSGIIEKNPKSLMQEYPKRLTGDVATGKLDARPSVTRLSELAVTTVVATNGAEKTKEVEVEESET